MAAPRLKPDRADHAELLSQDAVRIGGLALTSPPVGELIARTAFLIVLVIVTVLALFPHLQLPEPSALQGYFDKVGHVLAFVALALLGAGAWPRRWSLIGGLVCYAVILELLQRFSAGREVHIADALANLVGLAIGLGLVMARRRIRARDRARARAKSTPMATS
jgi:VanZ family protein